MTRLALKWRLREGYSRFLEGSELELKAGAGPFETMLQIHPLALVRKHEPVEFLFKAARSFSGETAGLRWRIGPEGRIRGLLLFAGNAFLGNFRVPANHFAVQWDIEARAESTLSGAPGPLAVSLRAGTRLYHSWVCVHAQDLPVEQAFVEAWREYRNPFDPADVYELSDREVIRWRWSGFAQLSAEFSWDVGSGWSIPGKIPFVDLHKEVSVWAGMGATFIAREAGEFSLQLRRYDRKLAFSLRRERTAERKGTFSAGVELNNPMRFNRIGFSKPEPLKSASEALGQPLTNQLNRVCEQSLGRRLSIMLAASRDSWRKRRTLLDAVWTMPSLKELIPGYCQLLKGAIPAPREGFQVNGKLQCVRGKRFSLDLCFLDWLTLRKVTERETVDGVSIGPRGEVLVERVESLEKTSHRWDEIQFLRLVHREAKGEHGPAGENFWTWSIEDEVARARLRQLFYMALHCGVIREFTLPPGSLFPLRVQLLLGTRFSPEGLQEVKQASPADKWKALVRAMELAEPERYSGTSFWRDWIDSQELRERVDRDPIQSDLFTRYPVPGRTQSERTLVVAAYRKVKKFLHLLEHWRRNESRHVLEMFEVGLDMPVFVFFHLLCPSELRRSAALLTGELEQSWGDVSLLSE